MRNMFTERKDFNDMYIRMLHQFVSIELIIVYLQNIKYFNS